MFSRLTLNESFRHVASPDDWSTFAAYGEVESGDLMVLSMIEGSTPSRLDGYEALWARLAKAVHEKLSSGLWTAEGFDPARGPQPQQISRELWRSLKLDLYEQAAVGSGFKFVNLLISSHLPVPESSQQPQVEERVASIKSMRLSDVLGVVATPEEAAEYSRLKPFAEAPVMRVLGAPETEHERCHPACAALQHRLWARLLPRLVSGELAGEGFTNGSVEPAHIPARLWPELRCNFARNEAYTVGGLELHFFHVTISQARSAQPSTPAKVPGAVLRQLVSWIKEQVALGRGPIKKADLLKEAKATFPDGKISFHMLERALGQAQVPEGFLFRGRPGK